MLNEQVVCKLSKNLEESKWLLDKRKEALECFKNLDFPSFKYGIGILVDVSSLNIEELDPLEKVDEPTVINDDKIEVLKFHEAFKKYGNKIKEYLDKYVKYNDKFSALHGAFFNDSIFVRIPENTKLNKEVRIYLDLNRKTRIDNIFVLAEKNSSGIILEISRSNKGAHQVFRSQKVDILVEDGARLEYRTIQDFGKNVYQFSSRNACVKRDGFIYWIDCCIGSKFSQVKTATYLEGFGADGKSWGIAFGDEDQCYDFKSDTIHVASNTKSDMLTKVVLNGKARGIYRGLIRISPKAVGCNGYQKDDTILLSDDARADSIPNLEIENNDVKCSHGATISQVDNNKLFYMMSRGLNEKAAKQAIIEGFFNPILTKLESEKLQIEIMQKISKRLEAVN